MRDYANPNMHDHASLLWNFQEKCKTESKDISEEFKRMLDSNNLEVRTALRPLTHFYQRMATLREAKVAEDELLYRNWSSHDLSIITEILIPLQKVILKEHNEVVTHQFDLLRALYEDAKPYWEPRDDK